MAFARTVREEHPARTTIDQEIATNPRLNDIYDGLKWRLARDPDIGYRVPRTNPQTYVVHSYHWDVAAVVAAYRFDDDMVEIIDVQVAPLSE